MMARALVLLTMLTGMSAFASGFPEWMAGSWLLDADGKRVEEQWTNADGGLMLGMSKTVSRQGKAAFEFLRIVEADGKLVYLAMPHARPATQFALKSADDSRITFENLEHDYPQRILYWRTGDKLCARVEGTIDGKLEYEELCYLRVVNR